MSSSDAVPQPDVSGSSSKNTEPLACVSCRARKLKCDRTRPACTRCVKVKNECVYPESRRKPTFKRRNVKELEARLAQVEEYLTHANKANDEISPLDEPEIPLGNFPFPTDNTGQSSSAGGTDPQLSFDMPGFDSQNENMFGPGASGQLMGLGMSESLPPFEIMEELNNIFFATHYHYIPVIHSGRYYQAFYGAPLRKPPMCLQYAIWALAATESPKYEQLAEPFYKRARQYTEADEMKGDGEHSITVAHAQAWAIITGYEAKYMLFTRAAMSAARCTRLVQMMRLDRLDKEDDDYPPTLAPVRDWSELEERRRVFWGAFTLDAHASISTGWASLFNFDDIMTRLPASEEAFASGQEEKTSFLYDVFKGAHFHGFGGAIVLCEVFKNILRHTHRLNPADEPQDIMHGAFWKRHRDLDNKLSSLFMFLPEKLRLPQNMRDPAAVHTNLNLHASVISLHHAALEMIDKHGLPDAIKQNIMCRLRTATEEIVNIVKMTSHHTAIFKSPLCAISLYGATTVYVYFAKNDPISGLNPLDISNLEVIISAMEAIGRVHQITRAFLQQACLDIERNGLSSSIRLPSLSQYRNLFGGPVSSIPLLARTSISKHTEMSSPLPGRLPLANPRDTEYPKHPKMTERMLPAGTNPSEPAIQDLAQRERFHSLLGAVTRNLASASSDFAKNKRKRMSPSPGPSTMANQGSLRTVSNDGTDNSSSLRKQFMKSSAANQLGGGGGIWNIGDVATRAQSGDGVFVLPDRTTSSSASSPANRGAGTETLSESSHTSPGLGLGNTPEENRIDVRQFQGRIATPLWQTTEEGVFAHMTGTIAGMSGDGNDPWVLMNGNLNWDNGGSAG